MKSASSRVSSVLGVGLAATLTFVVGVSAASTPPDRRPPTKPTIAGQTQPTTLRPAFTFAASDGRTPRGKIRFRCAYDGAPLRPCARIHRPAALAFGSHVLRVRALDLAGNLGRIASFPFSITGSWDAARDFRRAPRQANPGPDSYGNNATWSYLYSSQGRAHEPATYRPLPTFAALGPDWEVWQLQPNLQSAAAGFKSGQTFMQPGPASPGQNAIVGWRSPLAGDIEIEASLTVERQTGCNGGNGIRWSLDQGAQTLSGGIVSAGGVASVARTATVSVGDLLYLVVEDNGNPACDATIGRFAIKMT